MRRREEGEGRAEEGSNGWKSSHWPSFVVRSVLLWKVYLPGKKFSDFQFLTVSQVGHGRGLWCTFDQQAGVGVRHVQSARSRSGLPVSIKIRVHKDLR